MSFTLLSVGGSMSTNIVTIEMDKTILDAAVQMKENSIGSLVVRNGEKNAGFITEQDIVFKIVAEGLDPAKSALKDFLNSNMVEIDPEESIFEARQMMVEEDVDYLLAVQNGELKGIVSKHDLLKG